MGKLTPTSPDTNQGLVTGSFGATGQSAAFVVDSNKNWAGFFNAVLWGTFVGTAQLERSFDGGTTWIVANIDGSATPAAYTGPMSATFKECERNVLWRWNCTAYTSGTANYRLSY